jgi:hypothetical protein
LRQTSDNNTAAVHNSRRSTPSPVVTGSITFTAARSLARIKGTTTSPERKMPPKKEVKEEKILLGRPGNNLKSGIVSLTVSFFFFSGRCCCCFGRWAAGCRLRSGIVGSIGGGEEKKFSRG